MPRTIEERTIDTYSVPALDASIAPTPSRALVLESPCATGKSFQIRQYLKEAVANSQRILMISPNILCGLDMKHQLSKEDIAASHYKASPQSCRNCTSAIPHEQCYPNRRTLTSVRFSPAS